MGKISGLNKKAITLVSTALIDNKINNLNDLLSFLTSEDCYEKYNTNYDINLKAKIRHIKDGEYCEIFSSFGESIGIHTDYYDEESTYFFDPEEVAVIVINCFKSVEKKGKPISLRLKQSAFNNLLRKIKISTLYS